MTTLSFEFSCRIKSISLIAFCLLVSLASAGLDAQITTPAAVNVCEDTSYEVSINNTGLYPETNILLNVTVAAGDLYLPSSTQIIYPGGSSAQDPLIIGSSLKWNLTDVMGEALNASESMNVTFNLTTLCEFQFGGNVLVSLTWANGSSSITSDPIAVNFPIMKLEKTPPVINAHRFDNVTYQVSVENTGTGPMYNVLVNDSPSAGLNLAYSTAGGLNWSYAKLEPGEKKTENLSFIVNSCTNLVNDVSASWGCNSSACEQKEAQSSILFVSKDPNLEYSISPDPITVPYCGNRTVNVSLSNLGPDVSYVIDLVMEFSGMPDDYIISNVSGATYFPGNTSFLAGDLVPGQTKYFTFDLGLPKGACSPSSGIMAIFPHYNDACGRPWTPPTGLISYAMDASGRPALSVSKSGPSILYVGQTGTYSLNLSYSAGSCAENITENAIVDYYPASFEVVQNGGGAVDTVNHTITWIDQTIEDGLPWSREIKLKAPKSAPCNCGNSLTNTLSVEAINDCCGCPLTGNSSVSTLIVCSNDTVFHSAKTATPSSQENCRNITYKTTYTFNQTGNITWNDLNFTERGANNQTFYGGSQTGTATFVLNGSCSQNKSITLGSPINLSFLSNCSALQSGDVLEIYVTLFQPSTGPFVEWSDLCIGPAPSGCPSDRCYHDAVMVSVGRSDFSLSMNLPQVMESCGPYDFTLSLNKNGPWNGSNMSVSYNDSNFNYVGPAVFSAIANYGSPVPSFEPTRSGHLLTWYLGDLITSGGSISFPVRKSCDQNRQVSANLSYKDNCGSPQSGSFSGGPLIMNKASLYIDKTPELIYAPAKRVVWRIYLTNKGSGTAYNTTLFDTLESGLVYNGSRINGAVDPANTTVSGQNITWRLGDLPAKKQMIIELNATIGLCKNLNNHVVARWGCSGSSCQEIPDDSTVIGLKPTVLIAQHKAGVMDDCGANTTFTIEAAIADAYAYNLTMSELLPAGLAYVPGSSIVTGATPTSTSLAGNPLVWRFDQPGGLAPGTRVTIKFNATVTSPCSFSSGQASASINYTNPCGSAGIISSRILGLKRSSSLLSISKTPALSYLEKDSRIAWTVTIKSIGRDTARNITLSDILPANTVYDAVNSSPPANSGLGTLASPLIWKLADMPRSSTRTITIAARVANCTAETKDEATISWSCCLLQSAKSTASIRTLPEVSLSKSSGFIDTCGGDYTITISNSGTSARSPRLQDILPVGFIYKPGSASISSDNASHNVFLAALPDEPLDLSGSNRSIIWNTSSIDRLYRGETITVKFSTQSCSGCCDKVILPGKDTAYFNYTDSCSNRYFKKFDLAVSPKLAVLDVKKTPLAQTGAYATWTISVSNSGNMTANNVTVTEVLEPGLTSPVVTPPGGTISYNQPSAGYTTIVWSGQNLPVGSNVFVRNIKASANPSGGLANTVSAKGVCQNGCIYSQDGDFAIASRINISKSDSPDESIGDYANFTIVVDYWGSGEKYNNSRIIDTLPAGLKYSSYNCSGCGSFSVSGQNLTWSMGNFTGVRRVTINLSTIVEDIVTNQNGVRLMNLVQSLHQNPEGIAFSANDTANVTLREPDLALTKTVNKTADLQMGDILKYTLTASHTGSSTWPAYDLNVTDVMPAGISFLNYTSNPAPNATAFSGQNLRWYYNAVPTAQSVTIEYLARVSGPVVMGTPLKNDGRINWTSTPNTNPNERSGKNTLLDDYNRRANVTSAVNDSAFISKSPTGAEMVRTIGETVQYTITANLPPATARAVWINDTLPSGLRYENSTLVISGSGTLKAVVISGSGPTSINWGFGDVNNSANQDITIRFNATVQNILSNQEMTLLNRNSVTLSWLNYASTRKTTPASTSAQVQIREPDLALTKTVNKTADLQIGDILKYTLTASQTPSSIMTAYEVNLTDVMPAGVSFLSYTSSPTPNATAFSGQNLRWNYNAVPAAQSVTIEYLARVSGPVIMGTPLKNDGRINWTSTRGANPDERSGKNTLLDDYNRRANVTSAVNDSAFISKSPTGADLVRTIGETVQYTITANLPQATARAVWINDTLPFGLRYENSTLVISGSGTLKAVTISGSGPTIIGWSFGDVNNSANQDITIRFNATVQNILSSQDGTLLSQNNVTLSWLNYASTRKTTPVATSARVLIKEPDLQISKAANRTEAQAGDTIRYTLTATNGPPSSLPAYDVIIADHIPDEMALQSYSSTPPANATTVSGQIISWRYDRIPLGGSVAMIYNATLVGSLMVNDTVRNNATINWTGIYGPNADERHGAWTALDDYNRGAHVNVRVDSPTGLLKLPKEPRNASIGLQSNYTLVLRLPKAIVRQLWVNDTIPVGLIYDNSTLQITGAASAVISPVIVDPPNNGTTLTMVRMHMGDVDNSAGQNVTIRFNGTVADTPENRAGGIIEENWAAMTWKDVSGSIRESSGSSGILNLPAITVHKSADLLPDYPNSNVTFILNVTNTGKTVLDPIRITDTLPPGMEHVSDNMSATVSGRSVSAVIPGPLYPGQSHFREIVARFDGKSYSGFENLVNASGTPPVGRDVWDLDQLPLPDITSSIKMVKTANNTSPQRNENVTYTITVTNTGNLTQETVRVVDYLPPEMELLSTSPPATVGGSTVIWENVGPLGALQSVNLTMIMRLR